MTDLWNLISPDEAWRALFEEHHHALLLIDPSTRRLVAANLAAGQLYVSSQTELDGVDLSEIVDSSDRSALERLLSPSKGAPLVNGGRHRRSDGSTFHVHVHVTEVGAKAGRLLLATIVDKSVPDLIDAASGLPDPRLFIDRLEHSIAHAHRSGRGLGVCLLRIDRLEDLLNNLGAEASSRLLHDIGDRLRANLRESDTVARVGKAEFALVVEGVEENTTILEVLRKALDDFAYELRVGSEDLVLIPSAGVSVYPHDGHEADMLMENAAIATRRASDEGPGTIRFFSD